MSSISIGSSNYGVRLVTGSFGAGKTKNVFRESITQRKKNNPDGIIFANVPYEHVDYVFNTVEDFIKLLDYISRYMNDTNSIEYLKLNNKFVPILFIVDEAHIYLFARNFKNNITNDLIIVLTQCRKRNIQILFITQELAQLDVMIRRLCPEVTHYKSILGIITLGINFYYKVVEATDVGDEYAVELTGRYIIRPGRIRKIVDKNYKKFLGQKYLTRYIIGYTKEFKYTYENFYNIFTQAHGKIPNMIDTEANNLVSPMTLNVVDQNSKKSL